jgi:hypothetical protein
MPAEYNLVFLQEDNSVVRIQVDGIWTAEKQNVSGGVKDGFDEYMLDLFQTNILTKGKVQP